MKIEHALCLLPSEPAVAKRAAQRASEFCEWLGANLVLTDCVEPPPLFPEGVFPYELHDALVAQRKARLSKWAQAIEGRVAVQTRLLEGAPVPSLLNEVKQDSIDLVIKLAEPVDWATRLFGSLDMRLLRKLPCPVLVMKNARPWRMEHILVAVDPANGDTQHRALNEKLLQTAAELAKALGAVLHVLHAWTIHPQYLAGDMEGLVTPERIKQWMDANRRNHKQELDTLLQEVFAEKPKRMKVHLEEGDPASVVVKMARMLRADLLVMGTVARYGIAGLIMGNTAEKILGQVRCSVLALKPDHFSI